MLCLGNLESPIRIMIICRHNLLHELDYWHMADKLKCVFYVFKHVVVVQYTKHCLYWVPHPRRYGHRHQYMYPMLTSTDFGTGQVVIL